MATNTSKKQSPSSGAFERLGVYELVELLEQGPISQTHLARRSGSTFNALVVVEKIHPHLNNQKPFIAALLDSARRATRLRHDHIVTLRSVGKDHGTYYLVSDHVAGQSLGEVLAAEAKDKALSVGDVVALVSDVCDGLAAAHDLKKATGEPMPVVHHHMDPDQIVVLHAGGVKVRGFGLGKARDRMSGTDLPTARKAGYVSPEQISGLPVDAQTDVFSVGIVLWEALTRRRLFQASTDAATLDLIRSGEIDPPSKYRSEIPQDVDRICLRALTADPKQRYATMREMRTDLENFLWSSSYERGADVLATFMSEAFTDEILEGRKQSRRALVVHAPVEDLSLDVRSDDEDDLTSPASTPLVKGVGGPIKVPPSLAVTSIPKIPTIPRAGSSAKPPATPPAIPSRRPTAAAKKPPVPAAKTQPVAAAKTQPVPAAKTQPVAPAASPPEDPHPSSRNLPLPAPEPGATGGVASIILADEEDDLIIEMSVETDDEDVSHAAMPRSLATTTVPGTEPAPRTSRKKWLVLLVAAAALLLVVGLVLSGGESSKEADQDTKRAAANASATGSQADPATAVAGANDPGKASTAAGTGSTGDPDTGKTDTADTDTADTDTADTDTAADTADADTAADTTDTDTAADTTAADTAADTKRVPRVRPRRPRVDPATRRAEARTLYREGARLFVQAQGNAAKAKFHKALRVLPGYAPAYRGLGLVYQQQKRRGSAVRMLRKYLRLAPNARDAASIRKRIKQLGG